MKLAEIIKQLIPIDLIKWRPLITKIKWGYELAYKICADVHFFAQLNKQKSPENALIFRTLRKSSHFIRGEGGITPFGRDPWGGSKLNAPLLRRTVHFLFISLVRFAHRILKQKMPRIGALSAEREDFSFLFH